LSRPRGAGAIGLTVRYLYRYFNAQRPKREADGKPSLGQRTNRVGRKDADDI